MCARESTVINALSLCIGFFSCAPNSTFIQDWLYKSYEGDYKPTSWAYNFRSCSFPYFACMPQLLWCVCRSIHIKLGECKISKNGWLLELLTGTTKAVAHYMNAGFMKPLRPAHELLRMNTPFTDMIKYVLRGHLQGISLVYRHQTMNEFLINIYCSYRKYYVFCYSGKLT